MRPADPAVFAAWLRERTERMTTVVDSLYATRNLTLHSGLVGDEAATPPEALVEVLARRHHDVLSRLDRHAKPGRLDFARLTSPGPEGVWRK